MAANNSLVTAIDISGLLPYSITQDPGSVSGQLWYKYTGASTDISIGILGTASNTGMGHYSPEVSIMLDETNYLFNLHALGEALQVPINPGQTIYIKVNNIFGYYTPGDTIIISVIKPPTTVFKGGDFFINDDTNGFPACIFDSTGVTSFVKTIAGERGSNLPDNTMCLQDRSSAGFNPTGTGVTGNIIKVYNPTLTGFIDVPGVIADSDRRECSIATDHIDHFYVVQNPTGTNSIVRKINKSGAVVQTWTIPMGSTVAIESIAISRDRTILYYQTNYNDVSVRRYDLVNSVKLSNFITEVDDQRYSKKNILVLADGSVVFMWDRLDAPPYGTGLRHCNADGTVRYTKTFTDTIERLSRLHYNPKDDATSYNIWFYIPYDPANLEDFDKITSRFTYLSSVDGSIITSFNIQNYSVGKSIKEPFWDGKRFGPTTSCPYIIFYDPPAPPAVPDGIYFINPNKITRHDSYYGAIEKKIPDPTVRTAGVGE